MQRKLSTPEIAIIYARADGLIRLAAICMSIVFWFIVSVAAINIYLHDPQVLCPLDKPYQVASALTGR
ncbi:hypothetical protein [Immundisolibacter sp.]